MKKRFHLVMDDDLYERLHAMGQRNGLSDTENIREAIRLWLESMDWPPRRPARDRFAEK